MKSAKKLASLLLVLALILCLGGTAMAEEPTSTPTGTLTITNTKVGESYALYKVFDLSYASYETGVEGADPVEHFAYTINEHFKGFFTKDKLTPGSTGLMTDREAYEYVASVAEKDSKISAADLATDFAAWVKAQSQAVDHVTVEGKASTTQISVPYGYYLMIPSSTNEGEGDGISALFSLDTVTPTVEIANKSTYPTIDKKILETVPTQDGGTSTEKVEANTASVGDTVKFELNNMKVPNMQGYDKYFYVIDDTLSEGLTLNADSFVVMMGTNALHKAVNAEDITESYSVIVDEEANSFKIVFHNFIQYKDLAGKDITVTYSAVVNQKAVIGPDGNLNTVNLTYSNDPTAESKGDPSSPDEPGQGEIVGVTPDEYTKTYVTGIELTKVDGKDQRLLSGAVFEISGVKVNEVRVITEEFTKAEDGTYYLLKNGTYTQTAPTDDTAGSYASTTDKYTKGEVSSWIEKTENVKYQGTVGASGQLTFEGLAAGSYTITEIKAPTGYNLLEQPVVVSIGMTVPDGEKADMKTDVAATWEIITAENETPVGVVENGIVKITVENNSGVELPATGGMGTTLFYVLGSILLVGAVVLLVARKRVEASEK